jgi:hypothetical protein
MNTTDHRVNHASPAPKPRIYMRGSAETGAYTNWTRNDSSRHRGLATVFAVVVLGLVGTSLTAGAILLRNDARRTAAIRADAQLRQLLLAETTVVITDSQGWSHAGAPASKTWSTPLPSDPRLQPATLSVRFDPAPAGMLKLHITATLDSRAAEEDLQLHWAGDHWELTDAQLGPVRSALATRSR